MYILDIIILLILVGMGIRGAIVGFIRQLAGLISIVIAVSLAPAIALKCATWIQANVSLGISTELLRIIMFVLIFAGIIVIIHLIAKALDGVINLTILGILNKILGVIFSLLYGIIILGLIAYAFNYFNTDLALVPSIHKSKLYVFLLKFMDFFFPFVKQIF